MIKVLKLIDAPFKRCCVNVDQPLMRYAPRINLALADTCSLREKLIELLVSAALTGCASAPKENRRFTENTHQLFTPSELPFNLLPVLLITVQLIQILQSMKKK